MSTPTSTITALYLLSNAPFSLRVLAFVTTSRLFSASSNPLPWRRTSYNNLSYNLKTKQVRAWRVRMKSSAFRDFSNKVIKFCKHKNLTIILLHNVVLLVLGKAQSTELLKGNPGSTKTQYGTLVITMCGHQGTFFARHTSCIFSSYCVWVCMCVFFSSHLFWT